MRTKICIILRMALFLTIALWIAISFTFPQTASVADYVIQGTLVVAAIMSPFVNVKLGEVFRMPLLFGIIWGFWRMGYFDSLTENGIPGIGYFIVAIGMGLISMIIYGIRALARKVLRKTKIQ